MQADSSFAEKQALVDGKWQTCKVLPPDVGVLVPTASDTERHNIQAGSGHMVAVAGKFPSPRFVLGAASGR